jgi:Fur family peroxide stress response transcriptional regulator
MEDLVQKLRALGIAVTPQRLAVLAILRGRHDHPSAEKIYREVRRQLPAISFLKVNPLHEVAHYDAETSWHVHLICRQCRTIVNLYRQPSAPPDFAPGELQGFRVEHQSICLWGLCPGCQEPAADE